MAFVDGNLVMTLELACQSQRAEHIIRGRKLIGDYIASVGIETVERHAYDHLTLDDDWEFRRLAEIYALYNKEALMRLIAFGLKSKNPEVVEAATDFKSAEQVAPGNSRLASQLNDLGKLKHHHFRPRPLPKAVPELIVSRSTSMRYIEPVPKARIPAGPMCGHWIR
jgi:hypothetical protein